MLGFALAASVATLSVSPPPPVPTAQDTGAVDAPAYEISGYGVSVPRPFENWVFEPGQGRRTVTVIFHPRGVPLGEQVWGALLLTPYPGRAPLGQVADQRVQGAWRPQLGRGFALLARDSLGVAGFPAVHLSMDGAIGQVPLRVEEYVIARRRDLIVLQFRYPHARPADSLAAGYRRVLAGLKVGGKPAAEPPAARRPAVERETKSNALPWSPWQARGYEAQVRYDTARVRADFAVRMDLVNDGPVTADSAAVWLWAAFELDSVRTGASRAVTRTSGSVTRFALPSEVPPQGSAAVTLFYHLGVEAIALPPGQAGFAPDRAYVGWDWLPRVQPALDSAGQVAQVERPRLTLRFDVPDTWRAVAPGRTTAEVVASGRRRITWISDEVAASTPAFALGPYRVVRRTAAGLGVALWFVADDSPSAEAATSTIAALRAAWIFCSRAFGRLPIADLNLVFTRIPETRGFAGFLLAGELDPSRDLLFREVARSWWGNSVDAAGPGSWWILEAFPAWAAIAARGIQEGDSVRQRLVREAEAAWRLSKEAPDAPLASLGLESPGGALLRSKGVAALEAARRAAGEATFREAMLGLAIEHRNGWISLDDVFRALGPDAQAVLRPFLF
jgi:hypothetical protein